MYRSLRDCNVPLILVRQVGLHTVSATLVLDSSVFACMNSSTKSHFSGRAAAHLDEPPLLKGIRMKRGSFFTFDTASVFRYCRLLI